MSELSVRTSAVRGRLLRLPAITLLAAFVSAPLGAAVGTDEQRNDLAPTVANAAAATNPVQAVTTVEDRRPVIPEETVPSRLEGTDLGLMLRRDPAVLQIQLKRGGVTMVDPGQGFRSVLVMHIDPQGEAVLSCIATETEAEAILDPAFFRKFEVEKEP